LAERTEGWIAALQLAALSIQGREDVSDFIARFAGDDRYIVDYLVEEVLRHHPDRVRGFLLHSAVLDRLTGPLCDAFTGRDDGGDLLVTSTGPTCFIVPLHDRREWHRYHHLFADVLRARLLAEQPGVTPLLYQRASQWCEAHELAQEAAPAPMVFTQGFGKALLGTGELSNDLMLGAGWAINLAVAEYVIRQRSSGRRTGRPGPRRRSGGRSRPDHTGLPGTSFGSTGTSVTTGLPGSVTSP
jgi:hypothetical protein